MIESTLGGTIRKQIDTPDAHELAELYLIQADLSSAYHTMRLYFDRCPTHADQGMTDDLIVSTSLFRDAIVQFGACFSRSKKDRIKPSPEDVYGNNSGAKLLYQQMHDTRDAFVAHNFGALRQYFATALLRPTADGLQFEKLEPAFVRLTGWRIEERDKILSFMDIARDYMKARIAPLEEKIRGSLQALSMEELAALPDATFSTPPHMKSDSSALDFAPVALERGSHFNQVYFEKNLNASESAFAQINHARVLLR